MVEWIYHRYFYLEGSNMKKNIRILVLVTYITMVVINALANILPINGLLTGEVSASYPNLFAPAGFTFSIWILIYILLGIYTFYQLGIVNKGDSVSDRLLDRVGIVFSISSIANTIWIFAWHFRLIFLSMVLMVVILISLIIIVNDIRKENLTLREKFFVKLPFSVYFGWITVATIANATTLLVSWDWNGFGAPDSVWMFIIVLVGAAIGVLTILRNRDIPYGLVIIWAYLGILVKHLSSSGFAGRYHGVIIAVIVSIVAVIIAEIFVISRNMNKKSIKYL